MTSPSIVPLKKSRKKRTYNTRLIRQDYCYFVQEIADLFDLHPNAVRRWIRAGLSPIDDGRPMLIHGGDLISFLEGRQAKRKHKCRADEFYCCGCRKPRRAHENKVDIRIFSPTRLNLRAVCSICGTKIFRGGGTARLDEYRSVFDVVMVQATHINGWPDRPDKCQFNLES